MAGVDGYSLRDRLRKQFPGNNVNLWGTFINYALDRIEEMKDGFIALAFNGARSAISGNDTADEAHYAGLVITGTGGTYTLPGVQKLYLIDCSAATGAYSFTTGSGASATVEAGNRAWVICPDGVNYYLVRDQAVITAYQSGDAATLAAAKAFTTSTAFSAQSGTYPGQGGAAGRVLQTDGSNPSWGPQLWWQFVSGNITLALDTSHAVDTSVARTLTLPALSSAKLGQAIRVADAYGNGSAANITVNPASGDHILVQGVAAEPALIDANFGDFTFIAAAGGWEITR